MKKSTVYAVFISLIVALGGFLLGFDSAVISGATPFYKNTFQLTSGSFLIGFSVSSILLGGILGTLIAGYFADRFGRKAILSTTAFLFCLCAIGATFSQGIMLFIVSRIVGGVGVGMAILVAPMYISEIAPKKLRGTLVTFNQMNIVIGISIAFFSNYIIQQQIANPDLKWRWMLGVGVIPAIAYFVLLFIVPESPRWLIQKGRDEEGKKILKKINGDEQSEIVYAEIKGHIAKQGNQKEGSWKDVFSKKMKTVLIIGFGIAFFQQITGINAIFYYAPMIFEMAGGAKDSSFIQAAILGLTNVVITVVSMILIDKLGRRPLLIIGAIGITLSLSMVGVSFLNSKFKVTTETIAMVDKDVMSNEKYSNQSAVVSDGLTKLMNVEYTSETAFFNDVKKNIGNDNYNQFKESILKNSISIYSIFVLIGLILYVASFAISLGPVMWALLSEIFPNQLRGKAISIVGFWNAIVSFVVASIFPMELELFGSSITFIIFAAFGFLTLLFVIKFVPETKGKSLEELEDTLVRVH